jgi:hypothetical protein
MVARVIALMTAASLLCASAGEAHSVRPAVPPGATAAMAGPPAPFSDVPTGAPDHALLLLGLLVAAVGASCLAWRLRRPTLALLAAGSLVAGLAVSAPHLVHHALEPGQGAECQVLQVASHADGTLDDPHLPTIVMAAAPLVADLPLPVDVSRVPGTWTRAPPA